MLKIQMNNNYPAAASIQLRSFYKYLISKQKQVKSLLKKAGICNTGSFMNESFYKIIFE